MYAVLSHVPFPVIAEFRWPPNFVSLLYSAVGPRRLVSKRSGIHRWSRSNPGLTRTPAASLPECPSESMEGGMADVYATVFRDSG